MDNKTIKRQHGWNLTIQNYYFSIHPDVPKGTFLLLKRKSNYYWYFKLSKGKDRTVYLGRGFKGKNDTGQTSFEHCLEILNTKFDKGYSVGRERRKRVSPYIDEYNEFLKKEGIDPNGRRKMSTIKGMEVSLNNFKKFCNDEDVRVEDIEKKEFRDTIRKYIRLKTEMNLSRSTIRKRLIDIRSFLNWLVDDDLGKGIIDDHLITRDFLIRNYPVKIRSNDISQHYFSTDHHKKMYRECIDRVRKTWNDYCKNGHSKPHSNQPIGIGTDIVFFISLFQLGYGFRVGEILNSYRNFDSWNDRIDKKTSSSYFTKQNGNWFLMIRDYKNKDGMVGIHHTIKSWNKPPSHVPFEKEDFDQYDSYVTNIVDVCDELFPKSTFLFPSPNYRSNPNKPYSNTYYMGLFKSRLVNKTSDDEKLGWERYGIKSTHDLRDYFISYNISLGKLTPYELSTITRHQLSTMEKFYVRLGYQEQYNLMMKMNQMDILKKK
jgi:hypothetical protein